MKLDILYASQTGNAEIVAKELYELAITQGFEANIDEMNNYSIKQFNELKNVAIVTSTFGEGEVPDGNKFWEDLKIQVKLNQQKYGMIALHHMIYFR